MFDSSVAHDQQTQGRCREVHASLVFSGRICPDFFPAFRCAKGGVVLESVQYDSACGILHGGT